MNLIRTGVNVKITFFRKNPVAFRILPKITVMLDDSVEFRGFINLDAEINCIDKITYKQLTDIIIILNLNMEIISHSNYRIFFIKICKNVRLAVRSIKYKICLFVIDVKTSHFLVLGTFFIFQSNLNFGTEKDTD
jgi:hypothetical protein